MSRMDEGRHPEVFVFVEDREAAVFLREIVAKRANGAELLNRIAILPVGPANVVALVGRLGLERRLPYKSLAFIDGDKDESPGVIKLPGMAATEIQVFQDLKARGWGELAGRFGIGAGSLFTYLEDAMLDPDHHKWTFLVGDKVVKSAASVWEILANEWVRKVIPEEEIERITRAIHDQLDAS
jgi:hypothetical protein